MCIYVYIYIHILYASSDRHVNTSESIVYQLFELPHPGYHYNTGNHRLLKPPLCNSAPGVKNTHGLLSTFHFAHGIHLPMPNFLVTIFELFAHAQQAREPNLKSLFVWVNIKAKPRGGGLGSRPKKMYGERLGDGVEYHLMSPTPRR